MTRIILTAAVAIGLLATPGASPAGAADALRLLATVAHQQAEAAAEDAKDAKQETKKKRPSKPIIGGIKGESVDDAHGSQIDIQ